MEARMEHGNNTFQKVKKSMLPTILGCYFFYFPLTSVALNCQEGWIATNTGICEENHQRCLQQMDPFYCNPYSCDGWICAPVPDSLCLESSEYADQPYYTGGSTWPRDNCNEPDFSVPPGDPSTDPPSDDDPTSYCPI